MNQESLKCEVIFDLDQKEKIIERLEKQMSAPEFWNNNETAQQVISESNEMKRWVNGWSALSGTLADLFELLELALMEEEEDTIKEVESDAAQFEEQVKSFEMDIMLNDEDDHRDAILTIHSGAGGTESQDWAEMLMRMYLRWSERHGFQTEYLDFQSGEEAGIKSVIIDIKGLNAYGYLKAEVGVHRLIRISPFDANRRRHTSFASIFVYPDIGEDLNERQIEIDDKDLKIDTYRASGAGGQHVNKTDSAVRITHLPTNIVAQCQNERSQHKNKTTAMKILRSRLYQKYREDQEEEKNKLESQKKKIEWGSQIRSYVFQPYTMVKDHRTRVDIGNIQAVMDGDIDRFIHAYLKEFSGHSPKK
ncbi:MAG: peptide chain release factor 2 [Candidatus Cloacimonetes bacterium 4572_55]|nr:MAG: peptide chain release factor 2 [Candidatus Cloacimonetes bacterium 4572_55]